MYRQIPSDKLGNVDLVEQAVIGVPVDYFVKHKGIRFERDCDDLDYYDGAFFTLEDRVPFALIHYRGNPEDHTAIYLDRGLRGDELWRTVTYILEMLDVPRNSLTWLSKED